MPKIDYESYLLGAASSRTATEAMRRRVAGFPYRPLVSLLMVVSDEDEVWIKATVASVMDQIYPRLELLACDNDSKRPHVRETLAGLAEAEDRLSVGTLPERTTFATACNETLSDASGGLVALVDPGDTLAPEALFRVVESLQGNRADAVYADEDVVDAGGARRDPRFKPYWSPELLLAEPYTGRLCVVRRDLFRELGGLREGFGDAGEHDLMLRLSEKTDRVLHLPRVLYHRRDLPGTNGAAADGSGRSSVRVVEEALARRGEEGEVVPDAGRGSFRVARPSGGGASVVALVPEEAPDSPLLDELERAPAGVGEVIRARVEREARGPMTEVGGVAHPFPARALNLAASRATGEHLVFLDGRSREATPGWLGELLGHAGRRGVGAVGCRLVRPDNSTYYAGSFADVSRLAGRPDEFVLGGEKREPLLDGPFNPLVVPAGCLAVSRTVFEEAGGFDDENLPTAFYDLDLCLRLREMGLKNVYTPYATVGVGLARDQSVATVPGEAEVAHMWRRWWGELVRLLHYRYSPLHPSQQAPDLETLALLGP